MNLARTEYAIRKRLQNQWIGFIDRLEPYDKVNKNLKLPSGPTEALITNLTSAIADLDRILTSSVSGETLEEKQMRIKSKITRDFERMKELHDKGIDSGIIKESDGTLDKLLKRKQNLYAYLKKNVILTDELKKLDEIERNEDMKEEEKKIATDLVREQLKQYPTALALPAPQRQQEGEEQLTISVPNIKQLLTVVTQDFINAKNNSENIKLDEETELLGKIIQEVLNDSLEAISEGREQELTTDFIGQLAKYISDYKRLVLQSQLKAQSSKRREWRESDDGDHLSYVTTTTRLTEDGDRRSQTQPGQTDQDIANHRDFEFTEAASRQREKRILDELDKVKNNVGINSGVYRHYEENVSNALDGLRGVEGMPWNAKERRPVNEQYRLLLIELLKMNKRMDPSQSPPPRRPATWWSDKEKLEDIQKARENLLKELEILDFYLGKDSEEFKEMEDQVSVLLKNMDTVIKPVVVRDIRDVERIGKISKQIDEDYQRIIGNLAKRNNDLEKRIKTIFSPSTSRSESDSKVSTKHQDEDVEEPKPKPKPKPKEQPEGKREPNPRTIRRQKRQPEGLKWKRANGLPRGISYD
jgi:hypothetical protein